MKTKIKAHSTRLLSRIRGQKLEVQRDEISLDEARFVETAATATM